MIRRGPLIALAVLLLASCSARPEPVADDLVQRQGRTPAFAATHLARLKPKDGEPVQLTLHWWRSADCTLRLLASKADVDLLAVRWTPTGDIRLWSPRQREVADATNADPDLPLLVGLAPLIASELADGPIPPDAVPGPVPGSYAAARPGLVLSIACDGDVVTRKTITTSEGRILLAVAYRSVKTFDGLQRPTMLDTTGPDGEATLILRRLDPLGDLPAERLRLDVPADAVTVPLTTLLEHLDR